MVDERAKQVLRDLYLPRGLDNQISRAAQERGMSWDSLVLEFIKQGLDQPCLIPPTRK